MSSVLMLDCPHCPAEHAAFVARGWFSVHNGKVDAVGTLHRGLLECPRCRGAVVVHGMTVSPVPPSKFSGDLATQMTHIETFPTRAPIEVPAHVPADIVRVYLQGAGSRRRGPGHFDGAGMLYRKVIDMALAALAVEGGSGTLAQRISGLVAAGGLTKEMGTWAHEVRLLGNVAAHESEEPAQADVDDLHHFVTTFLMYAFTLPEMVKVRQSARLARSG